MNALGAVRQWFNDVIDGWNRFWFEPADPATLGLIRILAGSMMLYTHLVWSLNLTDFIGPRGWLPAEAVGPLQQGTYAWSYFWAIEHSPALVWMAHLAALVVFTLLTLGLFTRVVSILAWAATLAYVQRLPGALFGLDQINLMLAMYLAVGPSGDAFSLDRLLQKRRTGRPVPVRFSWTANLAIRLIQLHMCIIYFFAGIAKLTGPAWWDGTALWMAFGNLEYQSLDMTWMADWPVAINLMTQVTLAWELSYWALVWPRMTRPVVLALAVPLHMGIGICLGMMTFGLAMLYGNLAFVSPALVRRVLRQPLEQGRAGEAVSKSTIPPAVGKAARLSPRSSAAGR